MKIVGISAANIKHQRRGTSVKLIELTFKHLRAMSREVETKLISLVDCELNPCIGCGNCAFTHECQQFDDGFISIYKEIIEADALIIAAAHYAPIPAKLCALFERIESISFLGQFNDEQFALPLKDKPYAVIGHAGGPPEIWQSYYDVIFAPIKNALDFPVAMKPIDSGEWPEIGVMVGPKEIRKDPDSIFPVQIYDEAFLNEKTRVVAETLISELNL